MNYRFSNTKSEIYVVMVHDIERLVKKICCNIKCGKNDIIVTPGYSKTYLKDMYCKIICENAGKCNKNWNNNCFANVNEEFEYGMFHTTRHNSFLHRTLYNNGKPIQKGHPMRSYYEYERESLENIVSYEVISGISFSPVLVERNISKDYAKENKNVLELPAFDNIHYNVYVFVNPKGNEELYKDLEKYKIDSYIMECDKFEIVVGVHIQKGVSTTAITDFTGMYIGTHPNKGVGGFRPLDI